MTAGPRRLGVSIQIGEVVVTVAGPAPAGVMDLGEAHVRAGPQRRPARALGGAQPELAQEQG